MATRLISKTWKVEGVLTNVTTAKLKDPTDTYGVKRNDTNAVVVSSGTAMDNPSTGVYEASFEDVAGVAYTAYVEIVYAGVTYYFEVDIAARTEAGVMPVSYASLLERVGHFAFGIRSGFTASQVDDIEDCIRDGLYDVYSAYSWSFLRPVKTLTIDAPYSTGTVGIDDGVVTLTDGVFPSWAANGTLNVSNSYYVVSSRDSDTQLTLADTSVDVDSGTSYVLSRIEYPLPSNCMAIEGEWHYEPGQAEAYPPLQQRHDSQIRRWLQDNAFAGRPMFFSVSMGQYDPTVGSAQRITFYPIPDAAYTLKARMLLRWMMIDDTNQYPIGGEMLSPLIQEACLAAAERNFDDLGGVHRQRFAELLPLAIQADLQSSTPVTLGRAYEENGVSDEYMRARVIGDITYNGVIL